VSSDDITRLHQRINALDEEMERRHEEVAGKLGDISTTLASVATSCGICRPIVMGNGGESIDRRVTRLETARAIGGKGFWLIAGAVATLISGVVAAVVATVM